MKADAWPERARLQPRLGQAQPTAARATNSASKNGMSLKPRPSCPNAIGLRCSLLRRRFFRLRHRFERAAQQIQVPNAQPAKRHFQLLLACCLQSHSHRRHAMDLWPSAWQ